MFSDQFNLKAFLAGLFGYLIASNLILAVVFHYWIPPGISDVQQMALLAEKDPTLLAWQCWLGSPLLIVASFMTTRLSGSKGLRNSLILGIALVLYGMLGIYLHPTHPFTLQAGKVLAPIPVSLVGGWLRLSSLRGKRSSHDHH